MTNYNNTQIFEESVKVQNLRLKRQQDLQKKHMKELQEYFEEHSGGAVSSSDGVPL